MTNKKLIKIIIIVLALAVLVSGGILLGTKLKRNKVYAEADALYIAGDYAAAKELYALYDDRTAMDECDGQLMRLRYEAAKQLLNDGDWAKAKSEFTQLKGYADSDRLVSECDLAHAKALMTEGNNSAALDILAVLGTLDGAEELYSECRDAVYRDALGLTYECKLDEAVTLWAKLGDYLDSPSYLSRCSSRIITMAEGFDKPVCTSGRDIGTGNIYWSNLGLLFVPAECNSETRCMIFYPGGYDDALANAYVQEYIYATKANAIMLFCYTNGYGNMDSKIEASYRMLEQAAIENGVFLHDMLLAGASMGAYTACQAAVYLYENYGIEANDVMTFDAGMHWTVANHVLNEEQCITAGSTDTSFLLLEGPGIGMNYPAIRLMVDNGCDVTIILCHNHDHYGMIYDAISYGLIDWALGTGERPEVENYTYIRLFKDSLYPDY